MRTFISVLEDHQLMINSLTHCTDDIETAGQLLLTCLQHGGKILLCGNGGSAADCQHIAAELVVRYESQRRALAAIALTTDSSILTAHSNDYGFESVYARQIEALGATNDVLCAISTSGNSANIINAAQTAQQKGMKVIVLTGGSGGDLIQYATTAVVVPSFVTARIQEAHILIGHWWCALVENHFKEVLC